MATIHVTPEMLGDVATEKDVEKMAKMLRERGYDVVTGDGKDEFEDECVEGRFEQDWAELITEIAKDEA